MLPPCSTMPPTSCTSKWRWPRVRLAASRTTAKASGSRSSRVSPAASRSRKAGGHGRQFVVRHGHEAGLQGVDLGHGRPERLDLALIGRAEKLFGERAETQHEILCYAAGNGGPKPPKPHGGRAGDIRTRYLIVKFGLRLLPEIAAPTIFAIPLSNRRFPRYPPPAQRPGQGNHGQGKESAEKAGQSGAGQTGGPPFRPWRPRAFPSCRPWPGSGWPRRGRGPL